MAKKKSNIKTRFTNTKGEKVTVYKDGTKTRSGGKPAQLAGLVSQVEQLGGNADEARAMLAQDQAEGYKPYKGSSYETQYKAGKKFEPTILSTQSGREKFQSQIMPTIMKANEGLSQMGIEDTTTQTDKPEEMDPLLKAEYDASLTPEQKQSNDYIESLTRQSEAVTRAYDEMAKASARTARAQTQTLKRQYQERKAMLETENRTNRGEWQQQFIRSGQAEYSPGMTSDFLSAKEREGQARIQEANNLYMAKVDEVNAALEEKQYSIAATKAQEIQKIEKDIREYIAEQEKLARAENARIAEQAQQAEYDRLISAQLATGETDPLKIVQALSGKVPFDQIKEITSLLPKPEGPVVLGKSDTLVDPKTGKVIARGIGEPVSVGVGGGSPITPVGTPIVQGIGSSYNNSSFEAQMLMDDIMNKIPVQLKNSEKEVEMKYEQIRKQLAAGYTYQQIVDRLSGFSLQPTADKEFGNALYDLALGTDIPIGDLASLLNRGADEQAMVTVENAKLKDADGFFAQTDKARSTVEQADKVLGLLTSVPSDKLGAFDGRVFKVEKQLTPAEAVAVQNLETALAILNAPLRVAIAGTASTAQEAEKIAGFQASITDQPAIIKSKVEEMRDSIVNFHNEARSQRGLPNVDRTQLTDNEKRISLYKRKAKEEEVKNMTNKDLFNTGSWATQSSTPMSMDVFNVIGL